MYVTRVTYERVAMVRLFSKFENAAEVIRQWTHHFDAAPPHLTTFSSKKIGSLMKMKQLKLYHTVADRQLCFLKKN